MMKSNAKKKRPLWLRIARRIVTALVLLAAVFFLAVVPLFFSWLITSRQFNFPDRNVGRTPATHNIGFEWIDLETSDGLKLKGWYVPAHPSAPKGTIVFCHGLNRSRVEFIDQAIFAHGLGYSSVMFDFRHQGESEGEVTTLGYQERLDVLAAADYARQRLPDRPLIVWGISMGAASALMAAAESEEISAVISDSTFLSLEDTVAHHARMFLSIPKYPVAQEVTYLIGWWGGFWPSALDIRDAVDRIGSRPILFVAVEDDRRMPSTISRGLYQRAASPDKRLLVVPGDRHGGAFQSGGEEYKEAVRQFLEKVQP